LQREVIRFPLTVNAPFSIFRRTGKGPTCVLLQNPPRYLFKQAVNHHHDRLQILHYQQKRGDL
ncbi:hypothetical protein CHARACLAT_017859, partial [Characodon lateralis]|nr:hypothetical protein [Characodon lateralis]